MTFLESWMKGTEVSAMKEDDVRMTKEFESAEEETAGS
jgi:hypothetical protein